MFAHLPGLVSDGPSALAGLMTFLSSSRSDGFTEHPQRVRILSQLEETLEIKYMGLHCVLEFSNRIDYLYCRMLVYVGGQGITISGY